MSTCYDCGQNECRCAPRPLPEVLEAVVLAPGDKLVVMLAPEATPKTGAELAARLRELLGEDRSLLVGGSAIRGLAAIRATKAEGSTVGQCGDEGLTQPIVGGPIKRVWCHLAYGHTGMHSDGEATWSNDPGIQLQPEGGVQ